MTKAQEKTLLELLGEIPDYRTGNAIKYKLSEVLTIGILAIMCKATTFTGMQLFGKTHENELRERFGITGGIPTHDTFGDIFSRINPEAVEQCFSWWLGQFNREQENQDSDHNHVIAIDGKTVRRSHHETHKAHHIVTAFCSDLQLVLGQVCTEEKSNEITAIPQLLDLIKIKGCTVTIDAMGTQRQIAEKIIAQGADYILDVKANQSSLLQEISEYAESQLKEETTQEKRVKEEYAETIEKGHGRIEVRRCWLFPNMSWYEDRELWCNVSGFALIRSKRTLNDGTSSTFDRWFIYSHKDMTACRFMDLQRKHWKIENSLHWVLDVRFNEDSAHIRLGNAAVVLNMFRKQIMQLLKQDKSYKGSMESKLLRCAWDFNYAASVLETSH